MRSQAFFCTEMKFWQSWELTNNNSAHPQGIFEAQKFGKTLKTSWICIYSFCSIELTKTRNTWRLTAVKTTCADQRPNKKMATRDAVGSGIVPAFVSADPSSSQTDKCLGRPITKRWGSAARHSSSENHICIRDQQAKPSHGGKQKDFALLRTLSGQWDPM